MVSALGEPATGEWYVVPQAVRRVADQYEADVPHRWIVAAAPVAGQLRAVLRTTKPTYSEVKHAKHDPAHQEGCKIDENGFLVLKAELFNVHDLKGCKKSCDEPSDEVLEMVMGTVLPSRRPARRRGPSR